MASDPIVRVPADLRAEARQEHAFRVLKRMFPTLLIIGYAGGVLTEVVVQERGLPKVLTVESEPQQEKLI